MSQPRRKSLRDFDDQAIAVADPQAGPTAKPEVAEGVPPASLKQQAARVAPRSPVHVRGASETTRSGIYFRPQTFEDARSAYLVDLDQPDAPDSIARWIDRSLRIHAARSIRDRAQLADSLPPEGQEGSGFSRSFELSDDTIAARDAAIAADRRAGRATSRSQFASEAIRHAIEQARTRNGGVLPPAPTRLPNKPVR